MATGKTIVKRILWSLGGIVVGVVVLMIAAVFVLNSRSVQDRLVKKAVTLLSEKLQTEVSLDSLSVDLFRHDVRLYGLCVEDRQQRTMLQMDCLTADIDIAALMHRELRIPEAAVEGLHAYLYKPSKDSVANYQFLIESFKKDRADSLANEQKDSAQQLTFDLSRFKAKRVSVTFNDKVFSWGLLDLSRESGKDGGVMHHVALDDFRFQRDNHLPRKNTGKPHRGFFDAGHLDLTAKLRLDIDYMQQDSLHACLHSCQVRDSVTGFDIRDLQAKVAATPQGLCLTDILVRQIETEVRIDSCRMQLPDKKSGRPFTYATSQIQGTAILRDIARPFAPVLKDFTLPILFKARMLGDVNAMEFRDVEVFTEDHKFEVQARGSIHELGDKYKLHVHFDVDKMKAQGGVAERIIHQFPVKRMMMKQLRNLGTIRFRGGFDVFYKREVFKGVLGTQPGSLNVNLSIDGIDRYLQGSANTNGFQLGRVMDLPDIGPVSAGVQFRIDISRVRTAVMRHRKGGKLPIGEVNAQVSEASYRFVKTHNLKARIVSDGAQADGQIDIPGGRMDILCSFSFTDTDNMKKMKIKPGVKFHKLSDERKAERAKRKEKKEKEKEKEKKKKKNRG